MPAVTVSPEFQVMIPAEVREALRLRPGQRVDVVAYDHQIVLVPLHPLPQMRGFLRGMDTAVQREPDREL